MLTAEITPGLSVTWGVNMLPIALQKLPDVVGAADSGDGVVNRGYVADMVDGTSGGCGVIGGVAVGRDSCRV